MDLTRRGSPKDVSVYTVFISQLQICSRQKMLQIALSDVLLSSNFLCTRFRRGFAKLLFGQITMSNFWTADNKTGLGIPLWACYSKYFSVNHIWRLICSVSRDKATFDRISERITAAKRTMMTSLSTFHVSNFVVVFCPLGDFPSRLMNSWSVKLWLK